MPVAQGVQDASAILPGVQIEAASALVTGAGRGIGRSIALKLAEAGAAVTLVSRTASELERLADEIRAGGGRALAHPGDVCDPALGAAAVAAARAAHGRLQILVNNAGVASSARLEDTSDEEWERVLGTNLTAPFRLTRAALPQLADGGGHVFMISSLAGRNPIAGLGPYCASKAALDHMTACLMLEVRQRGVKVTTIAPGSVQTAFGHRSREGADWMLQADDVAQAVLDLLRARDAAHLSRVEMRPSRPQPRD
jgi:NAD(P)-dependent dehydrogenase (short-subunit alcohol dehydrogenase family)